MEEPAVKNAHSRTTPCAAMDCAAVAVRCVRRGFYWKRQRTIVQLFCRFQYELRGVVCREAVNDCDIPETCTGDSSQVVAYRFDGECHIIECHIFKSRFVRTSENLALADLDWNEVVAMFTLFLIIISVLPTLKILFLLVFLHLLFQYF